MANRNLFFLFLTVAFSIGAAKTSKFNEAVFCQFLEDMAKLENGDCRPISIGQNLCIRVPGYNYPQPE